MWTTSGSGISPDTTENLPIGYVNQPYATVAQFKVPKKAPYNGDSIDIDHIVLTNVEGLSAIPASVPFSFACNPPNCSFKADSVGCVQIIGTPTTVGTYPLIIDANVYITPVLFLPFPTPGYKIVVYQNVGVSSVNGSHFDVSQNTPNPFNDKTEIDVNLEQAASISLKVSNLVGNEVSKQVISGKKGLNKISFDATTLSPGIYFYTVSDGDHSITKRMIIDRK